MNFKKYSIQPKMIVFDLDYTLWPFWVEMYDPPFIKKEQNSAVDRNGRIVSPYPEVPEILRTLKEKGYIIGVASRTPEVKGARHLISTFGWDSYFSFREIYPGSKVTHFKNITATSKISLTDMIFFDDEDRNVRELSHQGVVSILVHDGINKSVIEKGFMKYEKTHKE